MVAGLGVSFFVSWIREAARLIDENMDDLGKLDRAIGDGDHGANLQRGFASALAAVDEQPPQTPDAVLAATGRALVSKTGGASGPLYGSAFRQAGKALQDVGDNGQDQDGTGRGGDVTTAALGAALRAALDAVRTLGSAQEGDKTMVDALAPAVRSYEQALQAGVDVAGATRAAADAAAEGAEATIPLRARRGRASYLGERSTGHKDPGAASTVLILRALATVAEGSCP